MVELAVEALIARVYIVVSMKRSNLFNGAYQVFNVVEDKLYQLATQRKKQTPKTSTVAHC